MTKLHKHSRPPRPAPVGDVLYGINPVEAALAAGKRKFEQLLLKQGRPSPRLQKILDQARAASVPHSELTPDEISEACGTTGHQGIALRCGPLPRGGEHACLELGDKGSPLLVALDEVQDPQNLGAVVRSCWVFGAAGVVLPRHHSSPLSPAASKASAGMLEHIPVYEVANLARFLVNSRKRNFWVAGAAEDGEIPIHDFRREGALVLVLGSEGKGLRHLVAQSCDYRLAIPTASGTSLNVSAAAAVLLFQLMRPA